MFETPKEKILKELREKIKNIIEELDNMVSGGGNSFDLGYDQAIIETTKLLQELNK